MNNNNFKILQNGNSKLKNMLVYSHTPIKGCLDCSTCFSTCYAVKSYKQYPSVKKAWDRNLDLARNDISEFITKTTLELLKTKKSVVRIHSSGDFISQEYVEAWYLIAREFPLIQFYTYTKSYNRFDFSNLESLSNVNIILSFIGDKLNYGDFAHCNDLVTNHGAFLCPSTNRGEGVTCGNGCDYCFTNKNVCFLIH